MDEYHGSGGNQIRGPRKSDWLPYHHAKAIHPKEIEGFLGEAEATDRQEDGLAVKYDGPTLTNVVVVQMGGTK